MATITVMLSAVTGLDVMVDYASSDGSATAGSDYTAVSGTLTIPAGQTAVTFNIPITSDTLDEADETVTLTLSNPVDATLTPPAAAIMTILDNDTTLYLPLITK